MKKPTTAAVAFFRISELPDRELVQSLVEIGSELCASGKNSHQFQRKNSRCLVRKIEILLSLFEFLRESSMADRLSSSARLCFREIHFLLEASRYLLASCGNASGIWISLMSNRILTGFYILNQDISACLDVLPLGDLALTEDLREQIELLKKQSRGSKLYFDPKPEPLRKRIIALINNLEKGRTPDPSEIREIFVDGLQVKDAAAFRREIEFLEEQFRYLGEEGDLFLLHSAIALSQFAKFSLFGLQPAIPEPPPPEADQLSPRKISPPRDFCCPISLEVMIDPVVVSTGHTYDRSSIAQWIEEGRLSCPYSGQPLKELDLIPNRALRKLIMQWCTANNFIDDSLEKPCCLGWLSTRGAIEADRATAKLLVESLAQGGDSVMTAAAMELRLLASNGDESRASIAEAGAIPLLHRLLSSFNPIVQENSMTAIRYLSILEKNKSLMMEQAGCLKSIVAVMLSGKTAGARENATATLSNLSKVPKHKRLICEEEGAMEALTILLRAASQRAKKDSARAMFFLCTEGECWKRMVESGAAAAMIGALEDEEVAEEAAGALEWLVHRAEAAVEVARMEGVVEGLVGLMRKGKARGMENAAATLVAMCWVVGEEVVEKVKGLPGMLGLVRRLNALGTRRGMANAAYLASLCHKREREEQG